MHSPTIPGREPAVATHAARRFPSTCDSVGSARRFLVAELPDGCANGGDLLALMLSELATNSVQHADTDYEVDIAVTEQAGGQWVRVSVSDEAPGLPTAEDPPPDAPHGRGLRIVESLSDAWGVEVRRDRPGKTVWFTSWLGPADRAAAIVGREEEKRPVRVATAAAADAAAAVVTGPSPLRRVRAVLDGLDDRLALLESLVRAAPTTEPDTGAMTDFVMDTMPANERSSDDVVVLAARRALVHPGGGA